MKPRGFTLTEVMITLAITAILATLAIYGVRKYILTAKTTEPIEIINSIRAAQEAYRDETFAYFDVSSGNIDAYHPSVPPGVPDSARRSWVTGNPGIDNRWSQLGVQAGAPVQFGYACVSGAAGTALPSLGATGATGYPANPTTPWFVAKAVGDRDNDDVNALFLGSSFTDQIFSEKEDE
jgi:type IV pilus assembly protein PilA